MRIVFILLVATGNMAFSQLMPPPSIQSPNTASLGIFGAIGVNFNTGTPDISIPIHNIQSGSINVPVTLRYHQSSVRPSEHPGWVGLGWSLESTGVISRIINGVGDEFSQDDNGGFKNYYDYGRSKLTASDWDSQANLKKYYEISGTNDVTDVAADEFSFNFLQYSGTFYLTASGWKVICDKEIKVEMNSFITNQIYARIMANLPGFNLAPLSSDLRNYFQFTLTTEDGTKYVFGGLDEGGEDAVEYRANYSKNIDFYTASAWHLISITDKNNHVVKFKYHRKYPVCSLVFSASEEITACNGVADQQGGNILMSRHGGSVLFPVYLDEIIGETGKMKFNTSPSTELRYTSKYFEYFDDNDQTSRVDAQWLKGLNQGGPDYNNIQWEQLDEIQIKGNNDDLIKRFQFSYVGQPQDPSLRQRLTLDYIKEYGDASATGEDKKHSFKYNNVGGLPDYGGDKTDHWGYFNNRSIDGLSFSELQTGSNPSKNKNPNAAEITTGLLIRIDHPTGGFTQFDWEANDYSKVLSATKKSLDPLGGIGAGCRIKEIRSYASSTATPVKKTYYYFSNYNGSTSGLSSSGVLSGLPQYYMHVTGRQTISGNTIDYYKGSATNTANYGMITQGSPVAYSEVVEKNSDGSYTKYLYTSYEADINGVEHYDNSPNNTIGWLVGQDNFIPFSSRSRERGKLLRVTLYSSDSKPVQQTQYTYNNDPGRFNNFVKCVEQRNSVSCPSIAYDALTFATAFLEYTYRYNVASETFTKYSPDLTSVSTTKSYSYNSNGLIAEVKETQSDGSIHHTLYKYTGDYDNSTYVSNCTINHNICLGNASAALTQCNTDCHGSTGCLQACAQANVGQVSVCDYSFSQCLNAPGPNPGVLITLKNKHVLSPLVEEQTRLTYSNGSQVLLGGTLNVYQNVGGDKILPKDYFKIETNIPLSDLTQSTIGTTDGKFTYHPNYKLSGTVDMYDDASNILQLHKSNGVNLSYVWGYNKTERVAEVINAKFNEILFDGFEESSGWDAALVYTTAVRRSGNYSGRIGNTTAGKVSSQNSSLSISLGGPTKFKYSVWVFSDAPTVELNLLTNNSSGTCINKASTSVVGKWVLMEGECVVPANVTSLALRLDNNGGGTVWFDDVRLHPSEAQMKTYTYDPVTRNLTSQTNENSITTFFEYDAMNRLKLIRDQDTKILKQNRYHYQGKP